MYVCLRSVPYIETKMHGNVRVDVGCIYCWLADLEVRYVGSLEMLDLQFSTKGTRLRCIAIIW